MSEIDIERKSGGTPWWLWLLGLLVLAAIIWYAIAAMSARTVTPVATADNSAMMADNSAMMADANAPLVTGSDNSLLNQDTNMAPAMGTDANVAPAMGTEVDKSMSNSVEGNGTVPMASTAPITNLLSVVDAKEPTELYGKTVKIAGAPVQAAGTKVFWVGPSFEQKMLVVTDGSTNMNGINTGVAQRDRVNLEGTIQEITDFADAKTKYNLDDNAITYLTNKKVLLMATNISRDQN